jgi:copper resistance protein C
VTYWQLVTRFLAVVAITLGTVAGMAGPAAAHAKLLSSDPKDGSTVRESLSDVELVFSEEVNAAFAVVVVTGPGGENVADGKPKVEGHTLTQPLKADPADGGYRIAFRVVCADGHPISDELRFTLKVSAPTPTVAPAAAPEATAASPLPSAAVPVVSVIPADAATEDDESRAGSTVLIVIGAVVAVGALVTLAMRRRRGPIA